MATKTPTFEQGDTIRIKVTFRDWAASGNTGAAVDPDSVVVNLYNADQSVLQTGLSAVASGSGVYHYDWVLPSSPGDFYIEFVGTIDSKPTLIRQKIKTKWDVLA